MFKYSIWLKFDHGYEFLIAFVNADSQKTLFSSCCCLIGEGGVTIFYGAGAAMQVARVETGLGPFDVFLELYPCVIHYFFCI